ncbi:MAG: penicillin-binding protein 2 [Chloroflexi bacterium]|nr:penicillin-binding protein 2 [Chloroflexota bacterium]
MYTTNGEIAESNQKRRISWLLIVMGVAGLYVAGHLVVWQIFAPAGKLSALASTSAELPAVRGTIVDRGGHALVLSDVRYEVSVTPRLLATAQIDRLIPELVRIFNKSEAELKQVITSTNQAAYVELGRDLDPQVKADLDELESRLLADPTPSARFGLDAFAIVPSPVRVYPEGSLAAQVLGLITKDGDKTGLELRYDAVMSGRAGQRSSKTGSLLGQGGGYIPVEDGATLVLTIDRNLQAEAERLLAVAVEASKAKRGTVIILDASSGALLTLANAPSYDPGAWKTWSGLDPSVFNNMAVSSPFEPRATQMPLTLAAALEANVITAGMTYQDFGSLMVGNQRFVNWDENRTANGTVTSITDTVVTSRIYGTAYIGSLMGPACFYEMIRRMGFGEPTGIDLPAEQTGEMPLPGAENWSLAFLGMNAIGRSLTVTPLQLASAYGMLANGGELMRPYIVAEQRGAETVVTEPFKVRRVITPEHAATISNMLAEAVEKSEAGPVLPGYRFAGFSSLTGIPGTDNLPRGWLTSAYVGYGPLPNERYVILVWIDDPQEVYFGKDVAQPVFRELAAYLVNYMALASSAAEVSQ